MAGIDPSITVDSDSIDLGDGLKLYPDGRVKKGSGIAVEGDVAERFDLSKDHPLYGKRVLKIVISGMSDSVIKDGTIVQFSDAPSVPDDIGR